MPCTRIAADLHPVGLPQVRPVIVWPFVAISKGEPVGVRFISAGITLKIIAPRRPFKIFLVAVNAVAYPGLDY